MAKILPPTGKGTRLAAQERTSTPHTKPVPVHIPTAAKKTRVALPPSLDAKHDMRFLVQPPPVRQPPTFERASHIAQGSRQSYKPFYPGQKPVRHEVHVVRGGHPQRRPVYEIPKASPGQNPNDVLSFGQEAQAAQIRQQVQGAPGVSFRDVATSLVPKTFVDIGQGRKVHVEQIAKDFANAALNFAPGGKILASGAVIGRLGPKTARAFIQAAREGKSVGEAATVASGVKVATRSAGRRMRAVERDVMPSLRKSEARAQMHAEIDAQLPAQKAADIKASLDDAALAHAHEASRTTPKGVAKRDARLAAAHDFYDTLHTEIAKPVPGSPRTFAQAKVRLDNLNRQIDAFLEKASATIGHPAGMTDAQVKAEQLARNQSNAKYFRQQAGVTRSGRRSGASGPKVDYQPLLSREARDHAEKVVDKIVAEHPDNPVFRAYARLREERDQLAAAVGQHQENQLGGAATPVDFGVHPELPAAAAPAAVEPPPLAGTSAEVPAVGLPAEPVGAVPGLDVAHPVTPSGVAVAPAGVAAKTLPEPLPGMEMSLEEAKAQLVEGLKGARSMYGKEKAARHVQMSEISREIAKAQSTIANPDEIQQVTRQLLKGQRAQIDFQGLKEINGQTLRVLKSHVFQRDDMMPLEKQNLADALDAAILDGKVPRPHEMRWIEHVFGKKTALGLAQHAGEWQDILINALNIPRTLMATADFSAVGRQSLVAGASHPVIWGRAWPAMVKSMRSSAGYDHEMQIIKDDPLYTMALAAHVSFTDVGEHVAPGLHEEAFASEIAAHFPVIGPIIRGSARAYTGFLNKLRFDLFKYHMRIALAAGTDVQDEHFLRQIGKVINAPTGRGSMFDSMEHLMPAMNTFLFSPRLMLSRINYLDPTWYWRLGRGLKPAQARQVRLEALRGLFATAGAVSGSLWLFSQIPGVDIGSIDPRSADFGKLRSGNTRLDVAGGFQQYVRLVSELITNTSVSTTTGQKQKLGSGFGVPTGFDVLTNFVVNKFAPAPAIAVNTVRGRDAVGNPAGLRTLTGAEHTLLSNFTPLLFQDARDLYSEKHGGIDGITWALGGYGLGAFGLGLQTYKARPKKGRGGGLQKSIVPGKGGAGSGAPGSSSGGGGAPGSGGGSGGAPGS